MLRPSVEHALILACTGELDTSYDRMRAIQQRCTDKGEEGELIFVDFYVVVNRIWRGDLAAAKRMADDVTEMARQLGADFPAMCESRPPSLARRVRRSRGRRSRLAVANAIDASKRSGTGWHDDSSLTALGFLGTSLGNYEAAVNALQPLLYEVRPSLNPTEIFAASFLPERSRR